jgi:purine-nucleoside phosphorylase
MTELYDQIQEASAAVRTRWPGRPKVGIILGTGLGGLAEDIDKEAVIPYAELPHFPHSTALTHTGQLIAGRLGGKAVLAMEGRIHAYEGYSLKQITFPVRVMKALGCEILIVSNACGGMNPQWDKGDLMLIEDHINLMGGNPLTGPNEDRFGPRFPDMTDVYSPRLRAKADETALANGLQLGRGVYVALHGPSYETPAEIRFLRTIGADAVGMSTVPEAIAARHMGIEVLGISCISNAAAGVLPQPLDHNEVMAVAARVRDKFSALLEGIIERL